eukprot:TRINITY_DN2720_c0_g1_i2.p1 TRINITY_DN2720_c0_g1~~TRINITY_DN2720_c0_g1_i2.p1  ORF type:complete len:262 (-),score=69.83 TRINITY_DN2720_c0_g1_i2:148-816(-)
MYKSSKQDDYSYKNPTGDDTFYINVCGETNQPCEASYHAGVCQDNGASPPVYYPCGDASKGIFNDYPTGEEGVQLVYGSGQDCNGVARVSTLNIKCDKNAGTGKVSDVDETVSCRYTAAMSSKYACKGASGGGDDSGGGGGGGGFPWGWLIIGLFFGFVFLYLIIGAVVKWKVYGVDPKTMDPEIIPNYQFWKELPFLCYDGCKYTIRKVTMNRVCAEYSEI